MTPARNRGLLTARSACAAWGIAEIWKRAHLESDLEVLVAAQEPAATILTAENIPFSRVDHSAAVHVGSPEAEQLLMVGRELVEQFSPTVALVGLSAPGEGGIDEAVLVAADCPSFVLQDFWGDGNLFYGIQPDCYLVSDEVAAEATEARQGVKSLVLGSPRHARYAATDFDELRLEVLNSYRLEEESELIGFFGQPLIHLPGYRATVVAWARAVSQLDLDEQVVYRPHPSSTRTQVEEILRILESFGLAVLCIEGGPIERVITICTIVTSAMSNSNIDAAYVNHYSTAPKATPLYMLTSADVMDYVSEFQDVASIPTVKQGLARQIGPNDDVALEISRARHPAARRSVWQCAQELPDPGDALETAVRILRDPTQVL